MEAAHWAEERGLGADDEVPYLCERDHLVLARVLLAQGDADRALGLLQRLAALAEGQRRTDSLLRIRVVRARGLQAAGGHDAALAELAGTLALAAPWDGCCRRSSRPAAAVGGHPADGLRPPRPHVRAARRVRIPPWMPPSGDDPTGTPP